MAEAVAEVAELMKLPGTPAPILYNFAGVFSLASARTADNKQEFADRAMDLLHIYAELVAAGEPAEQRYPGLAVHLSACGPCGEDFEGLLAAVSGEEH